MRGKETSFVESLKQAALLFVASWLIEYHILSVLWVYTRSKLSIDLQTLHKKETHRQQKVKEGGEQLYTMKQLMRNPSKI